MAPAAASAPGAAPGVIAGIGGLIANDKGTSTTPSISPSRSAAANRLMELEYPL